MSDHLPSIKPWYLSKTIWTNFLLGVVVLAVPSVGEYLNQDSLITVFAVVNMFLRVISKDKITLW